MFGRIVRAHRTRLGVTQGVLASRTGLSTRQIRDLEAGRIGRPRAVTVRMLADAFGLDGAERDRFSLSAGPRSEPSTVRGVAAKPSTVRGVPAKPSTVRGARPAVILPSARPTPAQLPLAVPGFIGRHAELDRLDQMLAGGDTPTGRRTLAVVCGTPGVGKTALVVHWSYRVRDRFPDGQLYVNLRGFDPLDTPRSPAQVMHGLLDALDVPPQRIPSGLAAQAALYRSLLADRRVLVVLDNARDADQVRPLLPGSPRCLVLVTSRHQLTSLVAAEAAIPITVDVLSHHQARDLFTERLRDPRAVAERGAVDDIVQRCARLPLALTIVAARAACDPHLSLHALAKELADPLGGLDAFAAGDVTADIQAVLWSSYSVLSPPAARLFRLLGLHPGPDITTPAAASLAGIPATEARPLLTELAEAHLIVAHRAGRYAFHDLLRAYAHQMAQRGESAQRRQEAVHRVLDHYLHSAIGADRLLDPAREPITVGAPLPGVRPEVPTDHDQAMAFLDEEHRVLLAAVDHAAEAGFDIHTWQLGWAMATFLHRRGLWQDQVAVQLRGAGAAGRVSDPVAQALAQARLAQAYLRLLRYDRALAAGLRALPLMRDLGDRPGEAAVWHNLGRAHHHLGRADRATGCLRTALDLYRALGDHYHAAMTLLALGDSRHVTGDLAGARDAWRQALGLLRDLDHPDAHLVRDRIEAR